MTAPDHIALQRAVYEALSAHVALPGMLPNGVRGIGTFVHPDNSLPYVVIEAIASQPLRTQADALDDCEVVCAVYGDQPGSTQVRDILQTVSAALIQPLEVEGYRVVLQHTGVIQAQLSGDGRIYRGTCTLRVILEKQEVLS